ncbi:hypothetical protein [Bradyrhizobium sp. CCBAU 11386]|uniref:hypothetical protein n=1 Tax=Bradyrhizobium sp. CCBAU 11386 TaxID=1630837 RepID=UPI003FA4350B
MAIEAFGAKAALEGLDEAALGGLPDRRESKRIATLVGLQVTIARQELAALIDADLCSESH